MSAEPGAPAEVPNETDLVTHQALNERLELFERGFKSRLEIARREREEADRKAIKEIVESIVDSAIRTFKTELKNAEIDEKYKRWSAQSEAWANRLLSALAGIIISMVFMAVTSQCTELHNRITTLELKK